MKTKLIFLERKLRYLLYALIVYSLPCCIVVNMFPEQSNNILHNYIFIIAVSIFSFFAGLVIDDEAEEIKKLYEWDWNANTKSDYYCTEFSGLVWIGTFYYLVQMSFCMIFFPQFEKVMIGERYVYPYVFIVNSIIIYILYRLTIIKINYIKQEDDVH